MTHIVQTPGDGTDPAQVHLSPARLFLAFSFITLMGFGGVLPYAHRYLTETKHWCSDAEFAELHALGQLLPGAGVCNMALVFGYRRAGISGGIAALGGLMLPPFLLIIGLGVLYDIFQELGWVRNVLAGMSAVAIGLVLAMTIKLAIRLPRNWQAWLVGCLALTGVGILRLPFLTVVGVVGPLSIYLAWRRLP